MLLQRRPVATAGTQPVLSHGWGCLPFFWHRLSPFSINWRNWSIFDCWFIMSTTYTALNLFYFACILFWCFIYSILYTLTLGCWDFIYLYALHDIDYVMGYLCLFKFWIKACLWSSAWCHTSILQVFNLWIKTEKILN